MTSPVLALRGAVLTRCQVDAALAGLMGGQVRLHDEPPRASEPVYAVFDEARAQDWSTGSDRGHRHELGIAVWARAGSARTALLVAERMATLLDEADLVLDGHRLVACRVVSVESGRDLATHLARVTLRLQALTEVI